MILNHPLIVGLQHQIIDGLTRKSANSPSRWAQLYRMMSPLEGLESIYPDYNLQPQPFNFRYHPWTKTLHDTTNSWVCPKAAQMAVTETALNVALYNIDVKKRSVLYLLPKRSPDATDFSKDRFDTALELSAYLSTLFSDVNNIGHKKAGSASLYIRGTRSKSAVKSVPVGLVIMDEYDEMALRNVAQAMERMSGRVTKQSIRFSTPTLPDYGISQVYKSTTQEHYFFKCPSCSRWIELVFPDSLIITGETEYDPTLSDSHYICLQCKARLEHNHKREWLSLSNSRWISTVRPDFTELEPDQERGFYINQFYSMTVSPKEIAKSFIRSTTDAAEEQELHNSKGGVPFVAKGSNLQSDQILACKGTHDNAALPNPTSFCTIGIDQGKKIYYEISEWYLPQIPGPDLNASAFQKVLNVGYVMSFTELEPLMYTYQIRAGVLDYHPERRAAETFAKKYSGRIRLCLYNEGINGKTLNVSSSDFSIGVDRTSWLDQSLGRISARKTLLPRNIPREYSDHLCALIRRFVKDRNGNPIARYQSTAADHFGHAHNYNEIALPLAVANQTNRDANFYL